MSLRRTAARLLAAPAAAAVLALSLAGPASAHVTITPNTTAAGAFAVLTVSVPHGCDGSATTKVEVQIPEPILSVTPTRNPYWDVENKMVTLDEPVTDAHGNTVTERVGSVVYTAKTPLPDGVRDTFELSLQLPDEPGTTLNFPTLQSCEKGETGWVEVPTEGQDPHELEFPAPTFTLTAAEGEDGEEADAASQPDEDETDTVSWVGLSAGVLGLLAGAAAIIQVRRKP